MLTFCKKLPVIYPNLNVMQIINHILITQFFVCVLYS